MELFIRLVQDEAFLIQQATMEDGVTIDMNLLLDLALTQTRINPADCKAYNQYCPLYDVCRSEPSERVGMVLEDFTYEEPKYLD